MLCWKDANNSPTLLLRIDKFTTKQEKKRKNILFLLSFFQRLVQTSYFPFIIFHIAILDEMKQTDSIRAFRRDWILCILIWSTLEFTNDDDIRLCCHSEFVLLLIIFLFVLSFLFFCQQLIIRRLRIRIKMWRRK